MNKEIRTVDKEKGIVQITTISERWYAKEVKNEKTGLPEIKFVPSVTWIAESYPKGIGFYKYLANKGWDEAEAIKEAAADKGSRVHSAISDLLDSKAVNMESVYLDSEGKEQKQLSLEEYECLMSFVSWYKKVQPKVIKKEFVVFSDFYDYAGTVDLLCEIDGKQYIVDFKTSQYIWPSHRLQVSAYKLALDPEGDRVGYKLGILQLGYKKNKDGFKFTEIDDCWELFQAAQKIWKADNGNKSPQQKDYPLSLSLK